MKISPLQASVSLISERKDKAKTDKIYKKKLGAENSLNQAFFNEKSRPNNFVQAAVLVI